MTEPLHDLPTLARFRDDLVRLAPAPAAAAPRRSQRRLLLATLATVLGVSAAAWAAGAIVSDGAPVAFRYGAPPSADAHYGTTVPGSVALLADDVPDPEGGLPWGLRTFTTSRGFGCIQVGRVQDGKLGVLALVERGGRVRERGLFHELRPAVLSQATTCLPLDGAGHAFIAAHLLVSTDGVPSGCGLLLPRRSSCTGEGLRTIDVGLLGPRATSITFRRDGRTETAPTRGAAGGYLVVQRRVAPATRSREAGGQRVQVPIEAAMALTPASAIITAVAYRDAPACAVHPTTNLRGACGDPPGFTLIPQPTVEDVRTPVRAFAAPDRRGMRVRFRARVPVQDGRSAYNVTIRFPPRPCPDHRLPPALRAQLGGQTCGGESFGTTLDRNVTAGEQVRTTVDVPNIGKDHRPALRPGVYRVEVTYRVQPPRPRLNGALSSPGSVVGSARVMVVR